MGTIYFVGCKDCNVFRDLDKFYAMRQGVSTRAEALEYETEIKESSFRAGLLVSFMADHRTHNCVSFTEHDEEVWEGFLNKNAKEESDEFWSESFIPPNVCREP